MRDGGRVVVNIIERLLLTTGVIVCLCIQYDVKYVFTVLLINGFLL